MHLSAKTSRDIDPIFWDVVLDCKGKCVYCGLDGLDDIRILRNFCIDHLIPRQAKGAHAKENRVLSCSYCNRDCKGNYDPRIGAPKSAAKKVLLAQAKKYVQKRQPSPFFDDLYDALQRL
jgi:5-methylcytosine-specific restriction endonuclease McrA